MTLLCTLASFFFQKRKTVFMPRNLCYEIFIVLSHLCSQQGDLVYVNYARTEDFFKLERDMKINCSGKILIARYGKIFRGNKVKKKKKKQKTKFSFFLFSKNKKLYCILGFPGGRDCKESECNAGDLGSIPGSGRSPGEGNGYSSVFAWGIPWTEVPGGLQPIGSQRVRLRD